MIAGREGKETPSPPPRFLPLHKQDPVRLLRGGIRQQNIITSLLEKAKGANTGESFAPGPEKVFVWNPLVRERLCALFN